MMNFDNFKYFRLFAVFILSNQHFIIKFRFRSAIPEPGSDLHDAFMDSKIMEETEKTSTKQSSTTKAPHEEL